MRLVRLAGLVVALTACGGRAHPLPRGAASPADEVTLYRDRALIARRVEVVVPAAKQATVTFVVPAGVAFDDVAVLAHGELTVSQLRGPETPLAPEPEIEIHEDAELSPDEEASEEPAPMRPAPAPAASPMTIMFDVTAPRAGRYALALGYVTDRVRWDAAYTLTTTPAHREATLRGAIAIANGLDVALPAARTYVVDGELPAWREHMAEHLGSALAAAPPDDKANASPAAVPHLVGELALARGETRIELLAGDPPRPLHPVLVYDPIGTKLDNPTGQPLVDESLGTEPASPRVTESFEVVRPRPSSDGLPGGPVRLLERRPDGSLAVLGEARLFDAATRVAAVDTIAIGTADGVTGTRERREMTYDADGRRIVEEFVVTLTSTRARPVEVVLREHLYRGQNWLLAYQTAREPTKEGPQQISMRAIVPARGQAKVLYVVVYTGL